MDRIVVEVGDDYVSVRSVDGQRMTWVQGDHVRSELGGAPVVIDDRRGTPS